MTTRSVPNKRNGAWPLRTGDLACAGNDLRIDSCSPSRAKVREARDVRAAERRTALSHRIGTALLAFSMSCVAVNAAAVERPLFDVEARLKELARLAPDDRTAYCLNVTSWAPIERRLRITGPLQRQDANSQVFANALHQSISGFFFDPAEGYPKLKSILQDAANEIAFSELTPYRPTELNTRYNEWNEPAFQQAVLLVPIAIGYAIVQHQEPGNTTLQSAIRRWGDALFESASSGKDDFVGRYRGLDRRSLKASGYAFWGLATQNRQMLDAALKDFRVVLGAIGPSGADNVWSAQGKQQTYYVNLMLAPMTLTAYALARDGVDRPYQMTSGGGNLLQAVDWLLREMQARSDQIVDTGVALGSRGVGWLEQVVLEVAPEHLPDSISGVLHHLSPPLFAGLAGGPVTCLFRKVQ